MKKVPMTSSLIIRIGPIKAVVMLPSKKINDEYEDEYAEPYAKMLIH